MTPLDFLLGAVFTIFGFGILSFSFRFADRLPLLALICVGMQQVKEPMVDILKAIGIFTLVLGVFIFLAMSGSLILAKGLIWLLPI